VALLGPLLSLLILLALSGLVMRTALKRQRGGGLFGALGWGLLPVLVLAGLQFYDTQWPDQETRTALAQMEQHLDDNLRAQLPKPEQADELKAWQESIRLVLPLSPALFLCFQLALLAPLAAWMRRRRYRQGLDVKPEPLLSWSAPWWLAWLVLAPLFWVLALHQGVASGPDWTESLAWNVLVLGVAVQLFHGSVVLLGKLAAWSRSPRTRPLTPLALALAFGATLVLGSLKFPLMFVALTGLFEPWMDLRRLRQPPRREGLDQGGGA